MRFAAKFRERFAGAAAGVGLVAVLVLGAAYTRDLRLPGLYMDAINPEYLIPGILDPPAPVEYIVPGNRLSGGFPVLTGTLYHGSTQLYAALPFLAALGSDLVVFRLVQLLFGAIILLGVLRLVAVPGQGAGQAIAVGGAGLVAFDPAFVLSLKTQAYSCIFPLLLLLACVLLLRGRADSRRSTLRLVLAGVAFGLATFSYFIFAFFLPALIWLLVKRDGEARTPLVRSVGAFALGGVVGLLPLAVGLLLIRSELGGTEQLVAYVKATNESLGVTENRLGPVEAMQTVLTEGARVVTGEWPWLMILREHRSGGLETLKAIILVALPVLVLAAAFRRRSEQHRAIAVPMALVISFVAGATVFAHRLDGHHYTAVLPLLYAAFGLACAALWPRSTSIRAIARQPMAATRALLVGASMVLVAATSVIAQQDFHRTLEATGGRGLYSNAIDGFAEHVNRWTPDATIHAADWGFSMPLAFLSEAAPIRMTVDSADLRHGACAGKPQLVVFAGVENDERLAEVVAGTGQRLDGVTTYRQVDGVPIFQVARFSRGRDCP